jgi:dTDP-4-amino-4,6-dideoxygalactose transaminase
MKVPLVDLKANYQGIKEEIDAAVKTVITNTNFILGEEVARFEGEFASYCGTKYAAGVANGTDALKIALMAAGIKKGDEVITTPLTFIATAEAIVQAGGTPVFADIGLDDYAASPEQIARKITKNTRAILPVHLYGHPARMDEITALAKKHGLIVIEDCAQSFTAKYRAGGAGGSWKVTGSMGAAGCFSFFPAKNLGCFGDGGMITTNDEDVYKNIKILRNHGQRDKYFTQTHGFNSRLDTIQAAVLSVKLKYIDKWTEMRNTVAAKYAKALEGLARTPGVLDGCRHSFNYYTLMFRDKALRDSVQKHLSDNGVACQIYYPVALHLQKVYEYLGCKKGDFPNAEKVQDESLSLPMYPELDDEKINYIALKINEIVGG